MLCALATGVAGASGATQAIRVPPGYRVDVYARGLDRPTAMAFSPSGVLGRHFGWPRCWPFHRRKRLVGDCRGVTPPVAYLEPHSAPGGMAFWNDALYVAEWGEYLKRTHGRKVSRVVLREGRPAAVFTFATGFQHPLAVAVEPGGALLVADHGRGVIYRIRK